MTSVSPGFDEKVARAMYGDAIVNYAIDHGITAKQSFELSKDAARYESMSAAEKLAFDARLMSVQRGIPFVDACKRLGLQ